MMQRLRPLVTLLVLLATIAPLVVMVQRLFNDNLGANPAETLIHTFGLTALWLLLAVLGVSRLFRLLTPKANGWIHLIWKRRILGIGAFVYVILHWLSYFAFDMTGDWRQTLNDIADRPFILLGTLAWLLLIPLVMTSTKQWQKKLKQGWFTLHRWIYIVIGLALLHLVLLTKADHEWSVIMTSIFLGLWLSQRWLKPHAAKRHPV